MAKEIKFKDRVQPEDAAKYKCELFEEDVGQSDLADDPSTCYKDVLDGKNCKTSSRIHLRLTDQFNRFIP